MVSGKINRHITLTSRPEKIPNLSHFKLVEGVVPPLKDNELLIRSLYLSVDPYMRGRMGGRPSSHPPFELHECLTGKVVGEVLQSNHPHFHKGEIVRGRLGWADFSISNGFELIKIEDQDLHPRTFLGVLGLPGMTAYFGILDLGQPNKGDTVVVSAAAGAVGSIVGQIAKIKKCRVVGITGSELKANYLMNELNFDAAVNYKLPNFANRLKDACSTGVDVYFDNVGGNVTDQVFSLLNDHSRVVLCGQIATYNQVEPDYGMRHFRTIIVKKATVKGLIVWDYKNRYPEALDQLTRWLKSGEIKSKETILEGLENAPKAFLGLFTGDNIGKQLVKIDDTP